MHIKMSWMKSIKCLTPVLQKQAMTDNFTSSHSLLRRRAHPGYITLRVRLAYWKLAVRMVGGHRGRGGENHGGTLSISSSIHIVLASSSTSEQQKWAAVFSLFVLVGEERTQGIWQTLKKSPPCSIYIHSLDMCTQHVVSEYTLLCPVTILLEHKLILIPIELLTSGDNRKAKMNRCWTEPAFKVSCRDRLDRAQQDSPENNSLVGATQWNYSTQHLRHTETKGKGWVCSYFSICKSSEVWLSLSISDFEGSLRRSL